MNEKDKLLRRCGFCGKELTYMGSLLGWECLRCEKIKSDLQDDNQEIIEND